MFFWQLSEIFSNNFFKERKIAFYEKRSIFIRNVDVTSPRFLYFSKELAQFIVSAGYIQFYQLKKITESSNRVLTSFVKYFSLTFVHNLAFFPDFFGHRPHLFSLTHTKIGRISLTLPSRYQKFAHARNEFFFFGV